MKRHCRILFNTLTAISLLLALAAAALWVHSYLAPQEIRGENQQTSRGVANVPSGLSILCFERDPTSISPGSANPPPFRWSMQTANAAYWNIDEFHNDRRRMFYSFLGIKYAALDSMERDYFRASAIRIPHAWIVVVFGTLPLLWLRSQMKSLKRRNAGHCPTCGYDTRANPSRCSECGKEIERSENAKTSERDSTRQASTPSP